VLRPTRAISQAHGLCPTRGDDVSHAQAIVDGGGTYSGSSILKGQL
jgi:hypothetical protein